MTDKKTKQSKKSGNRPTHSLFVRTEQFSKPIVIRVAAMWNNPEKGYMGVKLEELELHKNPNKGNNQPPFLMFVNTKIYGQDALIHIGNVVEKEDKNGFAINFGDMVVFENKSNEEVSIKNLLLTNNLALKLIGGCSIMNDPLFTKRHFIVLAR